MSERSKDLRRALRGRAVQSWFDNSSLVRDMPSFAVEVVAAICDRIAEHGDTASKICREKLVEGCPSYSTLLFWSKSDPRIAEALKAAAAARAESKWDELDDIITDEFAAAMQTGSNAVVSATSKKLELMYKKRQFELRKRMPEVFGETADKPPKAKNGGSIEEAIKRMEEDGKIVVQRVIEIPAKEPDDNRITEVRDVETGGS